MLYALMHAPAIGCALLLALRPNDPRFEDQWALSNSGQRGGKQGADISATRAWMKTTGSDKVVVAPVPTSKPEAPA